MIHADRLDGAVADAFALVERALASGIPGAALGVVTDTGARSVRFAGDAMRVPERLRLQRAMLFDLASLTKVILTTPALLRLAEAGALQLGLEEPLARVLPDLHQYDLAHPVRTITIRQCLAHRSGLPAVVPLYTWGNDPRTLKANLLQRDWELGLPVYSDINFMLLGMVIERVTGRALAAQIPPGFHMSPGPGNAVATELCPWRERVMRGEVHDENAFALGGLAGHAGLFGSVDAVLNFALGLLNGTGMSHGALAMMREKQSDMRALGWEIRHEGWTGGQGCSAETLGHTGFTGTGLWIDFAKGYGWTLLTNRVHPSRHVETGIQALRREVGERLAADLA
jgi:CubicO group peptidase (beta-lactamase class C family)